MKHLKSKVLLALGMLAFSGNLLFTSCEDSNGGEDFTGDDAYVLTLAYQGTDGTFTYYTSQFEDVMTGSLSGLGKGIDHLGYYAYNQVGSTIFATGGLGLTDIVGMVKNNEGALVEIGGLSSFNNSLVDVVEASDNQLIGVEMSSSSDIITLHRIDAETVTVSSTTNTAVSELTALTGTAYSGMVQSGNYLFLSYYISNPDTWATEYTDKAQVAVFTYPGLEFVQVIEDERTGPVGGFGTMAGLMKDEAGNVYALSHSNPANGYSQSTKPAGILRINAGETSFDADYFFSFADVSEGKTTAHLMYLGNGKVFVEMNMADRSEQARWSDAPLKPAVLDLTAKTINYITGVPEHSGIGRKLNAIALYREGYIYMAVPEGENTFIYRINPGDFTATKGAQVEANFLAGFFYL